MEKVVTNVINSYIFSVFEWNEETEKIFVYGKKVDDFRTLDYNHIFTAGIGAIQELSKQNELLNNKINELGEQLKQKDSAMNNLILRIERLENK